MFGLSHYTKNDNPRLDELYQRRATKKKKYTPAQIELEQFTKQTGKKVHEKLSR